MSSSPSMPTFADIANAAADLSNQVQAATNDLADSINQGVESINDSVDAVVDTQASAAQSTSDYIFGELIGVTIKLGSINQLINSIDGSDKLFVAVTIQDETKQSRTITVPKQSTKSNDPPIVSFNNESLSFMCKERPTEAKLQLFEYKRLGRNKLLGEAVLQLNDQPNNQSNNQSSNQSVTQSNSLTVPESDSTHSSNKSIDRSVEGPTPDLPIATHNLVRPKHELAINVPKPSSNQSSGQQISRSPSPSPKSPRYAKDQNIQLLGSDNQSINLSASFSVYSIQHVVGRSTDEIGDSSFDSLLGLIDLTIVRAHHLKKQHTLYANSAFVVVKYGALSFRSVIVPHSNDPEFDNYCPIWMKKETEKFILCLSVWQHEKRKPKLIGNAFLPINQLTPGESYQFDLPLVEDEPHTDSELAALMEKLHFDPKQHDQSIKQSNHGTLTVKLTVRPRAEVEANFYAELIKQFDADRDGKLDESELIAVCRSIESAIDEDTIQSAIMDLFGDRITQPREHVSEDESLIELNKDDLTKLFRHPSFVQHDFLLTLHTVMLHGTDAFQALMMKDFSFTEPKKRHRFRSRSRSKADEQSVNKSSEQPVIATNDTMKIFVIDRETGLKVKELIPAYIQSAMLMYRSRGGRLLSSRSRVQNTLKSLTRTQGIKMNEPSSAKHIPAFVALHHINLNEIDRPVSEYRSFNAFFSRKLKAGARTLAAPDDARVAVSPADCRMMVFDSIQSSKQLWIKGEEFSIANLLSPAADPTGELVELFNGCSLVIARLSPQDYHRWHHPVDGKVRTRTMLAGEYNTVSPLAVRKNVNVYTRNHRCICPVETKEFGLVLIVAIAATMVGSIKFTECKCAKRVVDPSNPDAEWSCEDGKCVAGEQVKRFDEHGHFEFGGSTILILFQSGRIVFDSDLKTNSDSSIETLIKVGASIGRATEPGTSYQN